MPVTIHRADLTWNGNLKNVLDLVYCHNVFQECMRAHIVEIQKGLHMIREILQDPAPQ